MGPISFAVMPPPPPNPLPPETTDVLILADERKRRAALLEGVEKVKSNLKPEAAAMAYRAVTNYDPAMWREGEDDDDENKRAAGVRRIDAESDLIAARELIFRSQLAQEMRNEFIQLVHRYWPHR